MPTHTGFVPFRLIDVGGNCNAPWRILTSDDLFVRETRIIEYMTLSHCWGDSSFLH